MKRSVAAIALLAISSTLHAASAPDPGKLMKERIGTQQVVQDIDAEMRSATAALSGEASSLSQLGFQMGQPPMSDAQIAQTKTRMESEKSQIESLQNDLLSLQKQLDMAAIKDPAGRAAKQSELQIQVQAANEKLRTASEPFVKRKQEASAPLRKTDADFIAVLDKCFKDGTDAFASRHQKPTWLDNFTGQVHWQDAGKDIAWCGLFLQAQPYPKPFAGGKAIDGKYQYSYSPNNIWVQVGYFNVSLMISKQNLAKDEASAVAMVKKLLDLDALAALRPE
jgi:hypothetical protein